jgi:hypothetical protein
MFGKVLWCLFESQPAINSTSFYGASVFKDMNMGAEFPHFRKTPIPIQRLIKDCTAGAPEWDGERNWLRSVGNTVFPADAAIEATSQQTQALVIKWWKLKIEEAEKYLSERLKRSKVHSLTSLIQQRPSAKEAYETLKLFGE